MITDVYLSTKNDSYAVKGGIPVVFVEEEVAQSFDMEAEPYQVSLNTLQAAGHKSVYVVTGLELDPETRKCVRHASSICPIVFAEEPESG